MFKKCALGAFALCLALSTAHASTVNIGVTQPPTDLNPIDPADSMSTVCSELLFSPLVMLTDELKYEPLLAQQVEQIEDQHYRVILREDLHWSDGEKITADDLIFTLKFLTHPKVGSMTTQYFSTLQGTDERGIVQEGGELTGVKKIDDTTVDFFTKKPLSFNMFNDLVARMIMVVPQHRWKDFDPATYKEEKEVQSPTVTSGPMKLKAFHKDHELQLSSNETYHLGKPKIDGLTFKVMSGPELTVAFGAGDIDMNVPMNGMIPSSDYDLVKKMDNLRTVSGGPGTVQLLFINNTHLTKPLERQALSLAIDREEIVNKVLLGQGEPTLSFFTSASPYLSPDHAKPEYNPEKAKAMLQEAGFDFNKALQFTVPTGNTTREQVAEVVQAQLAKIGVKVDVLKFDFPTVMARAKKGDFDLLIMADTLVPLNPTYDLQYFITEGNYNLYHDPAMDKLIADMMNQTDDAELKKQAAQLQDKMAKDMPMMSLYAAKDLYAINKSVKVGEPKDQGMFVDVHLWEKE